MTRLGEQKNKEKSNPTTSQAGKRRSAEIVDKSLSPYGEGRLRHQLHRQKPNNYNPYQSRLVWWRKPKREKEKWDDEEKRDRKE